MTVKIILIFLQRKCIAKVQYLKGVYFVQTINFSLSTWSEEFERANKPSLDRGCFSSILHITSCFSPPMLRMTFSLVPRDLNSGRRFFSLSVISPNEVLSTLLYPSSLFVTLFIHAWFSQYWILVIWKVSLNELYRLSWSLLSSNFCGFCPSSALSVLKRPSLKFCNFDRSLEIKQMRICRKIHAAQICTPGKFV